MGTINTNCCTIVYNQIDSQNNFTHPMERTYKNELSLGDVWDTPVVSKGHS